MANKRSGGCRQSEAQIKIKNSSRSQCEENEESANTCNYEEEDSCQSKSFNPYYLAQRPDEDDDEDDEDDDEDDEDDDEDYDDDEDEDDDDFEEEEEEEGSSRKAEYEYAYRKSHQNASKQPKKK